MAGIVHSVGKDVYEFKPGDRVGALHNGFTSNGSFAEYSVAPEWTTFHLPHNVSLEEAATLPVAALTAALGLYIDLGLPPPWQPQPKDQQRIPLVIYGVSSACGAFAAKYARLSGLGPLVGIAGRGSDYAKTLVDYVVDYRQGEDALVKEIEDILAKEGLGRKAPYVLDAISENGTIETTLRFTDLDGGRISTLLPVQRFARDKENFRYPAGVKAINTACPQVFSEHRDFGYLWSRYMGHLLEDGRLKCHPYEVIPGGLNGVLTGLKNLKNGKASAIKYVYRIDETGDVDAVTVEEGPEVPDKY
jgi:NADPH:quinone reductase-like Zn-dependent oxidoreductase